MKTATHEINGITILSISGNIAQESVAVFRNRFSDLIERKKLKIILDLGDAAYISSMCLAIIVESKNKLTQVHGELKITVSKGLIRNLLEMTNLTKKIEVYDTVEEAVASFETI